MSVSSNLITQTETILVQLPSSGIQDRQNLKIIDLNFVEGELPPGSLHVISQILPSDPVTHQYNWQPIGKDRVTTFNEGSCQTIEVLLHLGVTDNGANELMLALPVDFSYDDALSAGRVWALEL
jgi:hypothetical protein